MNDIDIFDYSNAIDILIGMSDKQLQTLATKLVDRFQKPPIVLKLICVPPVRIRLLVRMG